MARSSFPRLVVATILVGIVLALVGAPIESAAVQTAPSLGHDIENGCGSEGTEWIPDTDLITEVTRFVALPVGLGLVSDFLKGDDSRQIFNNACNVHDRCYGTLGMSQFECDAFFYSNLADGCRRAYLPTSNWKSWIAIWDAPYFAICSAVTAPLYAISVGAAGGAAYSEAQIDARASLRCGPSKPEAILTGLRLTPEVLERAIGNGCHLVDSAFGNGHPRFGDGRWGAIASLDTGYGTQRREWVFDSGDINDHFTRLAGQGYALTDVEYGTDGADDNWQLIFSKGLGVDQRYRKVGGFEDFRSRVREAWDDGYRLVEIEQGDDEWVLVGHRPTGIGLQEMTFGEANAGQILDEVAGQEARGLRLDIAEFAEDLDDWVVVWSEKADWTASGLVGAASFHDLSVSIEGLWNRGRAVHDIEYGNGEWIALWYEKAQLESVPPCTGRDELAVRDEVAEHFRPDVVEIEDASRNPGEVAYCDPAEGTILEVGSQVTIYVYTEPYLVDVPDLRGQTLAQADGTMAVWGASLGDLILAGDRTMGQSPCGSSYGEGEIYDQSPLPSEGPVAPGTDVYAWVCVPGERVVNLEGLWLYPTSGPPGDLEMVSQPGWWDVTIGEGYDTGVLWEDGEGSGRVCVSWDYGVLGVTYDCGTLHWDEMDIRVVQIEWDSGKWFWRSGYEPECPDGEHCIEF